MYNKQKSLIKQQVRKEIFRRVSLLDVKNFVTLPNTNFWLENEILKKFPNAICRCFENDVLIYTAQHRIDRNPNIRLYFGNVLEIGVGGTNDFVWLDLCGCFIKRNIDGIMRFLDKTNFSNNAILAVTLCIQRHSEGAQFYEEFYFNYKEQGIVRHMSDHIRGRVTAEIIQYRCSDISPRSAIMNTYILNITK